MPVGAIVWKQLPAIDEVVPNVLYGDAQGTTDLSSVSPFPALTVKLNVDC